MRILQVIDSLEVGGAERYVVDLAVALQNKGHEVTVACSAGGLFAEDLARASLFPHILGAKTVKRRFSIPYARWLRRIVRADRFDVVHAHCYASGAAAAAGTFGSGIPLVLTDHTEGIWKGWAARAISRWSYRQASVVTAVSTPIRRVLIDRYDVPPGRVRVIANGVAPHDPPSALSIPFPEGWGSGPLVGVFARLQPEKGVGTFLEAIVHMVKARPDVRCVVVGDGPLRGRLMSRARQLGLERSVHFLGFQLNARAMLPALDVLVVPSFAEGAPLIILEAMSAAVPIVATAAGGIPEQVRDGREAVLVCPGDSVALARAVLDLVGDPRLAQEIAAAARERVRHHFSYDRVLREVEDVYRRAVGAGVPSSAGPPSSGIPRAVTVRQPVRSDESQAKRGFR